MLALKGYRLLGRRVVTGAGEIDLVVCRGRRVAFVEVKQRATLEAAQASLSDRQRGRVRRAADLWLARHEHYRSYEIGFDMVMVVGWGWPIHLVNSL